MIEVIDTIPAHLVDLEADLREDDACEILRFGNTKGKAIWRSFKNSIYAKTVLIDGKVAACWGLYGVVLGGVGTPWLLTTPLVESNYIPLVLLYREEVKKMLGMFDVLENFVDAGYARAIRLLKLIGFHVDDPMPLGPQNALFRRFEIKKT